VASPAVRPKLLSAGRLGYGPQLLACRSDRLVSHCARKAGLAELGVDLSRFGLPARAAVSHRLTQVAKEMLNDPKYRKQACRLQGAFARVDGPGGRR
jgi:hypothetical protein